MKSVLSTLAIAAATVSGAVAAPAKRQAGPTDAQILNYALTLEHLESTFYKEALQNFTEPMFEAAGFSAAFYSNVMELAKDEATHVSFLTTALTAAGAQAVAACTYDFGVTDVKSFVMTASVLEGVGVSAYLGAAHDIMNKQYLTAAGSILTVESRHSAYIRNALGEFPFPQPFDNPLTLDEVYTLAAPFIVSCPANNPALPVKAFPALSLSKDAPSPLYQNQTVVIDSVDAIQGTPYAAFITVTGPVYTDLKQLSPQTFQVTIPAGIAGQSYLVFTNCKDADVTDDTVVAGPAIVEIAGDSYGDK